MAFRPRLPRRRHAAFRTARPPRTRLLLFALLAGAIVTTRPAGVAPRAQELEAGEAQAYVAALSRDRPVMGLGPADFRVEEDGDRREVLRVEPAMVGFDVALLVDDSMVAGNNLVHIREALVSFVDAMRGHRISLIAFGDQRQTLVDYTTDTGLLTEAAERFSGFSDTSAYLVAAVDETALELAARRSMRPAIVLVTSEGRGMQDMSVRGSGLPARGRSTPDASRDQDAEAVAERLRSYGVVMHALALTSLRQVGFSDFGRGNGLATITSGAGAFRWMQENRERERMLDQGPNDSGGRLYKVSSTSGMAERLQRIATELTSQYLVTYHRPALDEPPEELRVRVDRRRVTVRATPVRYYIPPATVFVVGGVVGGETVYHHSPTCRGLAPGLIGQAIPVPLAALGSGGRMCPHCPGARTHLDAGAAGGR